MSKRRRIFDIDMPDEAAPTKQPETFPAGKTGKRGPMATAIRDNAETLRERERIEADIRAENDALAHEHVRLQKAGLIIQQIPLDAVVTTKLTRDRAAETDLDIVELATSIKDIGLSNPIRVEAGEGGTYELIQGFRRLQAYHALLAETGDADAWGTIPALIVSGDLELPDLYRRMVDENLVRKDISFAEMAVLAIEYANDPQIKQNDPNKAVADLFTSVSYQKRSYVRAFIKLMVPLHGVLKYAHEIPRALGLALVERIEADSGVARAIKADLSGWEDRSSEEELTVLRSYVAAQGEVAKPVKGRGVEKAAPTKAKTSFEVRRPEGKVKCIAGSGRLEIKIARDFSTIDRRKLEEAVQALFDTLEDDVKH